MSVYEWFKVCFKFSIALELEIYAISAMKTPANNQNKSSDMSKGIQEASFLNYLLSKEAIMADDFVLYLLLHIILFVCWPSFHYLTFR